MSKGSSESSSSSSEEGITGVGSLGCLCWESTTGTSHKGKATANIALNGPLCKGDILGVIKIWPNWGLNPGPSGYIPDALTTELSGLGSCVLASDSYQHVELKPSISCDRLHIQHHFAVVLWVLAHCNGGLIVHSEQRWIRNGETKLPHELVHPEDLLSGLNS